MAAQQGDFESKFYRIRDIPIKAEKSGSKRFALVMKYRTSDTHISTYAAKPFRSSDDRYGCMTWASKEEALLPNNVALFRDFVQRGFAHPGVGGSAFA